MVATGQHAPRRNTRRGHAGPLELTVEARPYTDFIGPVMPPMIACNWSRRRRSHDAPDASAHGAAPEPGGREAGDQVEAHGGGLEGVGAVAVRSWAMHRLPHRALVVASQHVEAGLALRLVEVGGP